MSNQSQISTNPPIKEKVHSLIPIILYLVLVFFATIVPVPAFLTREIVVVLVVWLGVICLWILETLHLAISGFLGCFLLYFLGTLNGWTVLKNNAFSGFSETTVWFVFSGLIIGLATHKSGLTKNIAFHILSRVGGSFRRILFGYLVTLLVITYMVPSGDAVTVIMCALASGIVECSDFKSKKNITKILFLVPAVAASVLNKAILHGTSAIVAAGMIEKFSGSPMSFSGWFIYMLPAQVILFAWLYFFMPLLFKPEPFTWSDKEMGTSEAEKFGTTQKKTALWLGIGMTLWFTDKLTLIRPDIVCMAVALGLLMPQVGVITVKELREELNWLIPIFLGTAFSLVNTLEDVGLFQIVSDSILNRIPNNMPMYLILLVIALLALLLHLLTGHTSMLIASMLPVILKWGNLHNISVPALAFAFLWGASGEFLVYQSGAFMIAFAYGYFSVTDLMKAGLLVILGILVSFIFLDLLWWPIIGF